MFSASSCRGTGTAITASQRFQRRLITDNVKDIAFCIDDIAGKARAAKKVVKIMAISLISDMA